MLNQCKVLPDFAIAATDAIGATQDVHFDAMTAVTLTCAAARGRPPAARGHRNFEAAGGDT